MEYLCNRKMCFPHFTNNLHKIDLDQHQVLGMHQQFDSTQLWKPRGRERVLRFFKTFRGLQLTWFYSPKRSMHSTPASIFSHCSFSHILFLNNTFLSHEHILLFQYNLRQIYFLMQRKATPKLSALLHIACTSLNSKMFAVFLTMFFLSLKNAILLS